jgi:hypothetical protein
MAVLSVANPTLMDVAKASDPDGKIATVVEILNETQEVLDDMSWTEGNLPTGHRTTIRTGIPAPTWRKLYSGVQPNKGSTRQVTDSCGMLEAYAEIDKALADLNGNTAAFRMLEDRAHIEGMAQELADALFFANESTEPEKFTGFAPRYNSLSAGNGENIIEGGGTGTDNSSIWLVCWGPDTAHGIIPKGSTAGLQMNDKGQVTIESIDGAGGRMEAYRTHYRWDVGLTVRDWRYVVRIANIDKSLLVGDASSGADLTDLMVQAIERLPTQGKGRPVFYCSRQIKTTLRRHMIAKVKQSTLTMDQISGKHVMMFDGISVKRCDSLAADEARVV